MNTKNYSSLTKKYRSLICALHAIYRLINTTYDVSDLIIRLTKLLSQIFKTSKCTIALLGSPKNKHFVSSYMCSFVNNKRIIKSKKTLIKDKFQINILKTSSAVLKNNLIATPLIHEDTIGFIITSRDKNLCRKYGNFDSFDLETLMTLAGQIVMAINNIQLYEEQQKIVLGTIKSLINVLDSSMPPPYTHTPHFLRLVKTLAQEMNMTKKEIESLQYASLLHDAGKINIPLEILTKNTRLTGEEYDIIKRHPIKSAEIIKHLEILKPAVPIIIHHHEKYDGTGYPSKLKMRQIPLGARVMSVADAFDAMVYGRPYRERISAEDALEEIKKNSGSQFDPQIVKCLVSIFNNKKLKKYLNLTR